MDEYHYVKKYKSGPYKGKHLVIQTWATGYQPLVMTDEQWNKKKGLKCNSKSEATT